VRRLSELSALGEQRYVGVFFDLVYMQNFITIQKLRCKKVLGLDIPRKIRRYLFSITCPQDLPCLVE
jgi:hypothetical protein